MVTFLLGAHSGWRYIVILALLVVIARMLIGWLVKGKWGVWDQRLSLITTIAIDIQFLLGLLLWISEARWTGAAPLASWEHPVTMILAVAAAHITSTQVKKRVDDQAKFRTGAIGYLITGVIVALGVARITQVIP
jgi:hypothetical protein